MEYVISILIASVISLGISIYFHEIDKKNSAMNRVKSFAEDRKADIEKSFKMLEERFKTEGGIKERMHRVRTGYRSDQDNKVHEMEAIIAQQAQRIKELELEIKRLKNS